MPANDRRHHRLSFAISGRGVVYVLQPSVFDPRSLVSVYKKENHPVPPPSPIEAIRFVMDQRSIKQVDLVPYIGSQSKVSETLRGKRT